MGCQVYLGNELGSGLTTQIRLEDTPPHLLVESLAYDGGFRDSGLRAGDAIVAIDGVPLERLPLEVLRVQGPRLPGQYQEGQRWAAAGLKEEARLKLTVRRKAFPRGWDLLTAEGQLRYPRNYRSDSNAALVFENGPDTYERDGFYESWSSWMDAVGRSIRSIACFGRGRPGLTTQYELKSLLEQQPRVALMLRKYPGSVSTALASDFNAAVEKVRGRLYSLTESDLAYRKADELRVQEVAGVGKAAWDSLVLALRSETNPAFPAPHPIHGKKAAFIGRCVVLESLTTRQWVSEVGHGYLAAGSDSDGWYFLDMEGVPAQRMLHALRRYQRRVSSRIRESYTLVGRILPEARILVMNEVGRWGLQIELLGAWIGEALFVDVRGEDTQPEFAGESLVQGVHSATPPDDAPPNAVLDAMIQAIKGNDLTTWKSLFADWMIRTNQDGSPQVCYWMQSIRDDDFERSRTSFAGRLYDARVGWMDDVKVVFLGTEYPGAPRVEEVDAEVEHIGCFNGEYRTFMDVTVRRFWTLQRINGGPWRISTLQQL